MKKFESALVVTHIAYRTSPQIVAIEGPYGSVCKALSSVVKRVNIYGLPLAGFKNEVVFGKWNKTKSKHLWTFLGNWAFIKFVTDIICVTIATISWSKENKGKNKLVVGIDPLSCLPLLLLKKIVGFTLVFHSVDFNKNRFSNKILQGLYELSDEMCTKYSDQTWVVCESLKDYKKNKYQKETYYLPNSVIFSNTFYSRGHKSRKGNKMVWTGSLLTERQFKILFSVLSTIQTKIRPDMSFVIAPTKDYEKFELYANKFKLEKTEILRLNGRLEFQKIAATCDVGIALYDETFGSTEFIEPMKIWDFLLCGLPFVVSSEPSVSKEIKDSGVAYFMKPKNKLPDVKSLKRFLGKKNLELKAKDCLRIARKYAINKQIEARLNSLLHKIN